jgi:hypothetical protein
MYTARTSRPSFPGAGERARLSIKGVGTPVGLRVARRRQGCVTLVQELPFLELGTEVQDENGRTGKIARVAVSIDRGVPKLVIELAYDETRYGDSIPPGPPAVKTPAASGRERDQTIGYDQRPTMPDLPRTVRMVRDETNRELTLAFRTQTPQPGEVPMRQPVEEDSLVEVWVARMVAFLAMLAGLVSPRTT